MKFAYLILFCIVQAATAFPQKESSMDRVLRVLKEFPIIDGHNDFPMGVRSLLNNDVSLLNFDHDLTQEEPWASYWANHIDIPRMRKGGMGGQFWSAFIGCDAQFKDATQLFLEQIDVIKQIVAKYPDDLMWADSSTDIETAISLGKVASMVGVESGHAIGSNLAILRTLYQMGARYITLTHVCNTPWADAAQVEDGWFPPRVNGLSDFGVKVVHEMNRLGMLVDLSHVSTATMKAALEHTMAPVIFSHSGSRTAANHSRNVPDDVLEMVKDNGGIVMVNFYACFVAEDCRAQNATKYDVVRHINSIRRVAGVDHVGIGGDYNGIDVTPVDLPDVSHYPDVFAALLEDAEFEWSDEDLGKLASGNLIRVLKEVERVRDILQLDGIKPDNSWIPVNDLGGDTGCMSEIK